MGGRVEGKKKKKSVKAKVTSKFSSKRKLSRMGKKVKKGEMGPSTEFITRSSALKRLQITLKDFRRLCILKGIYPRVPTTKAPKGSDKVYYDIKDISYLAHEPLLHKFREFKSFMKKIRRASGRNQFQEARRKNELKPVMAMDHLVKERYPRFIDALRDMDDALCMIHLFAALPSEGRITVEHSSTCAQLVSHWQYYIAKSRTLQKVFVSVKGIYYQAEIMGEPVTWLAPHAFTQALPKEVDIRVMVTFLEFYEVFIKFALFKLYHMQGLRYPPEEDKKLKEAGCFLLSLKALPLEGTADTSGSSGAAAVNDSDAHLVEVGDGNGKETKDKKASKLDKATAAKIASLSNKLQSFEELDEDEDEAEVGEALTGPLSLAFSGLQGDEDAGRGEEEKKTFSLADDELGRKLFSGLKIFVNREVPLAWMQLCTLSFGAQIGWDGAQSPFTVDDDGITHHVIDRPIQGQQSKSREYVQPQWVFDSINAKILLPVSKYRPGVALPPHLSPFVDDDKEGYTPKYKDEIVKLQATASAAVVSGSSSLPVPSGSNKQKKKQPQDVEELDNVDDEDDEEEEEEEEEAYHKEVLAEKKGKSYSKSKAKKEEDEEEDSEEDSEEEENEDDEEEEEEVEVVPPASAHKGPKAVVHRPSSGSKGEAEEEEDLAKIMMTKKTKRLYGRMQHGIEKKKDAIAQLENKRKKLDSSAEDESSRPSKKAKGKGKK